MNQLDYLKQFLPDFTQYTELRMHENRSTSITFVKGNLMRNDSSTIGGVSARVHKNKNWGFASNPQSNDEFVRQTIKSATQNAIFLDSRSTTKTQASALPNIASSSQNDFSTTKKRLAQKELITFAKELDGHIEKNYKDLTSRIVSLQCLDMQKTLVTSDGSLSHSMIPRAMVYFSFSTEKNGNPVEVYNLKCDLGQFEDVFQAPDSIYPQFAQLYEHLMKKRDGVFPKAGIKDCILAADLAGILAHEAIGHTTEADIVLGGSVAANYMNKLVASPLITLVDYANTAFGKTCPVPVYVDDEGTKASDTVIIEEGVLKSYMHNKESAQHFDVSPTGNARAFQFSDEPLVRMRNTAILPGTSKLEEMISSIDDGYYLLKPSNGQADSTSEFMFGVPLGYEIKKGKIGKAIKDTTISGVAFDVLQSVSMVSNEMHWDSAGFCGKKQPMPVGMGGPAIKCKVNIGGR